MSDIAKDLQIVQAKLDAIRSSVDSINRRLDNLERIAQGDQGGKQRYSW
ncbi:TPA: hypothetical protein HA265_04905 [Candidatus Woesearchaeota archaeon]|nr:hypothetical protein [Candidatus Woesearchaeota archaeon]